MLNTCTCSHCFLLAQGLCWLNILSSNSLIEFSTCITWFSSFLQASYFFCSIFRFCLTFNVWNVLGLICLSSLSLSFFPYSLPSPILCSNSLSFIQSLSHLTLSSNGLSIQSKCWLPQNLHFGHKLLPEFLIYTPKLLLIISPCMSNRHLKSHVAKTELSIFFCISDNVTYIHQLPKAKQLGLFLDFYSSNCYSWSICKLYCLDLQILLDLNVLPDPL